MLMGGDVGAEFGQSRSGEGDVECLGRDWVSVESYICNGFGPTIAS